MSTTFDPLAAGPGSADRALPDRLFYAAGVLLDAPDLAAEQLYHRGRLARSLAYLQGSGTVSGLRVLFQSALAPGDRDPNDLIDPEDTNSGRLYPDGREARILVQPGLAIDRLGRLIEVPGASCLRLQPWLDEQPTAQKEQATHPQGAAADTLISRTGSPNGITVSAANRGIVADVFIRFQVCEAGGRTPAFAAGAFDATNANVPARLRDSYEINLILRPEATNDLPTELPLSPWQTATSLSELQTALFESWEETTADWDEQNRPEPRAEHATGQDTTSVFLARLLIIPGDEDSGRSLAAQVDNYSRSFLYPNGAIARWIAIANP
ncbi:hypothetical protein [Leptothoe sp. PORK10 BA2]|uniref:hypothetical protein n=1 Tax=Leptothoe sp. PORK10 BA2 TaxID=3110254 RepID=UPI002B1FD00C|nr:hypothetical protein [Leptothoe sp. PORK10 BA2]MEA5463928.1 hypothetical protein [Leptothoe sp. PORK10 BA2]